jgi:hypothetical protein
MSQVVSEAGETYVEIYAEGVDVDLAVRCESDAVDAEECLVEEGHALVKKSSRVNARDILTRG